MVTAPSTPLATTTLEATDMATMTTLSVASATSVVTGPDTEATATVLVIFTVASLLAPDNGALAEQVQANVACALLRAVCEVAPVVLQALLLQALPPVLAASKQ
uniref:Uncharacterized protein n=1 Tax=Rhipicephalus zambeziensis TaxID=60191 RepID=A0A224Y6Q2_9ACAR